ncbi:hypothetical protein B0O80DRAFT_448898 [Mortierella sp. GBAus27b]|nr:hypothetical protein B0O80DRAFT_448898 [Mortierella sp. GBAus27b]
MADFEDELSSYLQARTASDRKDREEHAAAHAAADALFGPALTFPHPHPEGFQPTQDAPAFAIHPATQMWHDATTGTFSYYDAASETYIPVEGPGSEHPAQHQHSQPPNTAAAAYYDTIHYTDPHTGYTVELAGNSDPTQGHLQAPPESDATLRLCVLSSGVLKVGGVIMMDASGLSFGRDRPLSGQGKRVRMVEMEISRFHASIYLDRKPMVTAQEDHTPESKSSFSTPTPSVDQKTVESANGSSDTPSSSSLRTPDTDGQDTASMTVVADPAALPSQGMNKGNLNDGCAEQDEEREEGECPDSPDAGAQDASMAQLNGAEHDKEDGEEEEDGDDNMQETEEQRQYRDYQKQMHEYQHYYHNMAASSSPVYVDTFQITDCGSTHGTFLNEERLSAPKTASQPFALRHLDKLQLGSTVFEIHAHQDGRICGTCQVSDGNEIEVLDDKDREGSSRSAGDTTGKASPLWTGDSRLTMERERIEEMNRLKKKWTGSTDKKGPHTKRGAVPWDATPSGTLESGQPREYVDRAAKRRLFNPDRSSPIPSVMPEYSPHEEGSGFHVPVAKTNKGHAMLSKMGWKAGAGLGAANQGVVEPVQLMVADRRAGLGSTTLQNQGAAATAASRPTETAGEVARRKARERYSQLR